MSNISRRACSVFDTGPETNQVHTSFLPLKWCDCIRPIHNMSFKTASNNPVLLWIKSRYWLSWLTYTCMSTLARYTISPYHFSLGYLSFTGHSWDHPWWNGASSPSHHPSYNYLRIPAPVGFASFVTVQFWYWERYKLPTGQQRQKGTAPIYEIHHNSTELRSIWTSYGQLR